MKSLRCAILAVAVALPIAVHSADSKSQGSAFFGQLSAVAPAELPTTAAELVKQADAKNQAKTTIDVVRAAVGLNPAAAPSVVGSIAQSSPAMAATAAATAAALMPKSAMVIARAAAAAAPDQAGAIVEAMVRALPSDFRLVAETVAKMAPGAEKEILAGLLAAMPNLGSVINPALASSPLPPLNTVLAQAADTLKIQGLAAGSLAPTPVFLPVAGVRPSSVSGLPQGPSTSSGGAGGSGPGTVINPGDGGGTVTGNDEVNP
jgi:hypothetical protein